MLPPCQVKPPAANKRKAKAAPKASFRRPAKKVKKECDAPRIDDLECEGDMPLVPMAS